jgi:hypothetical protein
MAAAFDVMRMRMEVLSALLLSMRMEYREHPVVAESCGGRNCAMAIDSRAFFISFHEEAVTVCSSRSADWYLHLNFALDTFLHVQIADGARWNAKEAVAMHLQNRITCREGPTP